MVFFQPLPNGLLPDADEQELAGPGQLLAPPLLSPRQAEIMDLVTAGLTNKDIANRLGLTNGTVKQHLAAIFRKLGVSNRTWAVAMWREETATLSADGKNGANNQITAQSRSLAATDRHGREVRAMPRRLMAAATVDLPHIKADCPPEEVARQIDHVIKVCQNWANIYEGNLQVLPQGSILVRFGYPLSHIDDLDRARAFCAVVHNELVRDLGLAVRIGLDAGIDQPCIVRGSIVSSSTTRGSLEAMLSAPSPAGDDNSVVMTERFARLPETEAAQTAPLVALLDRAPFADGLAQSACRDGAKWFSIEAWPPLAGKLVLDSWRHSSLAHGTRTIILRMPSPGPDAEHALVCQVAAQAADLGSPAYPGAGLAWWLRLLSEQGPVTVLTHGWHDSATLPGLLDGATLDEIQQLPLIVAMGPVPVRGPARLAVRPLGPRGQMPLVSRLHELPLPEPASLLPGCGPDIVALLDLLDETTKTALSLLLRHNRCTLQFLAHQLEMPLPQLEQRIDRLNRLGLITMWPDRSVQLRDARTEGVVKEQAITKVIYP